MSTEQTTARNDIDTERQRQIMKGFTAAHDDWHGSGELVSFATEILREYADHYPAAVPTWINEGLTGAFHDSTPIQILVKAAAVIEAEIERLKRVEAKKEQS